MTSSHMLLENAFYRLRFLGELFGYGTGTTWYSLNLYPETAKESSFVALAPKNTSGSRD